MQLVQATSCKYSVSNVRSIKLKFAVDLKFLASYWWFEYLEFVEDDNPKLDQAHSP